MVALAAGLREWVRGTGLGAVAVLAGHSEAAEGFPWKPPDNKPRNATYL